MSGERQKWILGAIALLEDWPADARPDRIMGIEKVVAFAEAIGWIEQTSVMQSCKCCGEPRPGYSYHRITSAGQAALELHQIHKAAQAELDADASADLESERAADAERAELELRTGFTEDDFA